MLESHRDRLLLLQEKASDDIESLIKVSSELSEVQSELEKAMGQNAYLSQRVNMDIVNIQFQVKLSRSFWKPITGSLSDFSNNLSDGISGTIVAVAYLLPGIILFIFVFFFVRFFWKKIRNK
jgi:predicted PurR-regulated permease PerM